MKPTTADIQQISRLYLGIAPGGAIFKPTKKPIYSKGKMSQKLYNIYYYA